MPARTKVWYFFLALEIKQYQQFTYNDVFFSRKSRLNVCGTHSKPLKYNTLKNTRFRPMTTPFIELKDVAFAYGERPILSNVNFQIAQGNFAAIMGGSGSGKTTLMRLITGQLRAQQGQVLVEGKDVAAFSAAELSNTAAAWACCFSMARCLPICRCLTTWLFRCAN